MLKAIICSGAIFFASFSQAAVSGDTAYRVFHRLANAANIDHPLTFKVSSSQEINAESSYATVTINLGMLKEANNADEVALVLSHELAHIYLQHYNGGQSQSKEYDADMTGLAIMKNAGYNRCSAVKLIKRLEGYDTEGGDGVHPQMSARYKYMSRGCH